MKYVLIDAAILQEQMHHLKKMNPKHQSLYLGEEGKLMDSVAPFLFETKKEGLFNDWFMQFGGHHPCGYIVEADISFKELHHHFRKFLKVKTESGKKMYFRFYDPRVLPLFLRTSNSSQLETFFGPINSFSLLQNDGSFINFSFDGINLKEQHFNQEIKAEKIEQNLP